MTVEEWQRDEVRNEIRARVRNEWIEQTTELFGGEIRLGRFACECSFGDCPSFIRLSRGEYEAVRGDGGRFAIALDHENPELDRVVMELERFTVIEKWVGEPRNMALAEDPRRPPSEGTG